MREFRCFGPPGTGKTTWLASQIQSACDKYSPENIYACSFTRAAAAELAGRDTGLPKENVGTIHSLCYHRLDQPTILETDKELMGQWNNMYGHRWPVKCSGVAADSDWMDSRSTLNDPLQDWNRMRGKMSSGGIQDMHSLKQFGEAWGKFKLDCGAMDFTDLLIAAPLVKIGADVLIVDEAQDLSPLQWYVVRRWGEDAQVFIVGGDDDQSLFDWTGASPKALLAPLPADQKRYLRKSWRLPRAVHKLAHSWIARLGDRREPKEFEPRDGEGSVERVGFGMVTEPRAIIQKAVSLAGDDKTVMVLASCGYMLQNIVLGLRAAGIPFHNPYRLNRGDWNPLGRRSTANRVVAYCRLGEAIRERDPEEFCSVNLWRQWVPLIRSRGILKHGSKKQIEEYEGNRLSLPKILEWFEPEVREQVTSGNLAWLRENLMQKFRNATYQIVIAQKQGWKILEDVPRIVVGTIHSVKGGEADAVIMSPDISYEAEKARHGDKQRDAEDALTRVFYVGMTRARETLVLCQPSGRHCVVL